MHEEDRNEAIGLHDRIEAAIAAGDDAELSDASRALGELLFFVEGGR
jgi:DNA-binding FadR family transcriptional regulator